MTQTVSAVAVLGPGLTGLTLGYRVLNLDTTVYSVFTVVDVAETAVLGTYQVANGVVVPDAGGYIVFGTALVDYAVAPVDEVLDLSSIRASVVAAGGSIGTADLPNIVRYVTYSETISGLTIAAGWQTIELTIKERPDDTDANALLNIIVTNGGAVTDGLIVLQKQTAVVAGLTAADASLTVDQAAGTVAVYITHTATGKLTDYAAPGFDLIQNDGTDVTLLTYGKTNIYPTETH